MQLGNSANLVSASLVCVMTTAGADDTMETFFFSAHQPYWQHKRPRDFVYETAQPANTGIGTTRTGGKCIYLDVWEDAEDCCRAVSTSCRQSGTGDQPQKAEGKWSAMWGGLRAEPEIERESGFSTPFSLRPRPRLRSILPHAPCPFPPPATEAPPTLAPPSSVAIAKTQQHK